MFDVKERKMALVVIDVQKALIDEKPLECELVMGNIKALIEAARINKVEVIYIQHCGPDGGELEVGSDGWQIYSLVRPMPQEKVFRKYYPSAFKETGLRAYLEEEGIGQLIITGMQTEYCVDTTSKVAFDYGYDLIFPQKANTTYDNGSLKASQIYEFYNTHIWKDRFGLVMSIDDSIEMMVE